MKLKLGELVYYKIHEYLSWRIAFISRLWFGFHDFRLQRKKMSFALTSSSIVTNRFISFYFSPSTQYYLLCKEQNNTWHARACQSDWLTINKNRAIKSKKKKRKAREGEKLQHCSTAGLYIKKNLAKTRQLRDVWKPSGCFCLATIEITFFFLELAANGASTH